MADHLFNGWCDTATSIVADGRHFHSLTERPGVRQGHHAKIIEAVRSHYEDPALLADRVKRLGFQKAAKLLAQILPKTKQARSGHVGEILATEVVPAVFTSFAVPIKRLRWLDGRESAMRGEDVIAIALEKSRVRFLKGESKSGAKMSSTVIAEARRMLKNNHGRPSQHAMTFIMRRLFELGDKQLALLFEEHLLARTIHIRDLVHVIFTFSGNDSTTFHHDDLKGYTGKIEQHAINLRIDDHQAFIKKIYIDA